MYLAIADEGTEKEQVYIEDNAGQVASNLSKATPPDISYYYIDLSVSPPVLSPVSVDTTTPQVISEVRRVPLKTGANTIEEADIQVTL